MNGWDMGYGNQNSDTEYEWVMDKSMCLKKVPKHTEREITFVDKNQDIKRKKVKKTH